MGALTGAVVIIYLQTPSPIGRFSWLVGVGGKDAAFEAEETEAGARGRLRSGTSLTLLSRAGAPRASRKKVEAGVWRLEFGGSMEKFGAMLLPPTCPPPHLGAPGGNCLLFP